MKKEQIHKLDFSDIDEEGQINDDEQEFLIFCETHRKYEWHWLAKK
jgi:hypothetical protein